MPDGPAGRDRAPDGGRDLGALLSALSELSGQAAVPVPVAATLAALGNPPTSAELANEAAARAMYRAFLAVGEASARSGGDATRSRPGRTLAVSAGAAAAVVAVALFSILNGPAGRPAPRTTSAAYGTSVPGVTGTQGVAGQGRAASDAEPSATPAATARPALAPDSGGAPASFPGSAGTGAAALCPQLFASFARHRGTGSRSADRKLLAELSELAGSPGKIFSYCAAIRPAGSRPAPRWHWRG